MANLRTNHILAILVLASVLLLVPYGPWLGMPLVFVAVWSSRSGGALRPEKAFRPTSGVLFIAVLAIAAVSIVFRMAFLEIIPPGLYVDEAATARNALMWRQSTDAAWFKATPLILGEIPNLYLEYVSRIMMVFGDNFFGIRMVSILPSLAMVALVAWLGTLVGGRWTGLLAALFLACSHWAARSGRIGWDQVMMTALQLATLAAMRQGLKDRRVLWAVLAGITLGLCTYTYVACRLVWLHVFVWGALETIFNRDRRRYMTMFAICLGISALIAAPYAIYLIGESIGGHDMRTAKLSVFSDRTPVESVLLIGQNGLSHVLMFHHRGGLYARDNLPGFPMLDPVTGFLLLVGLTMLWRIRSMDVRMLITFFCICVLGGVLSISREGAPYSFRVANLAAWASLIAGLGASGLIRWLRLTASKNVPAAVVITACLSLTVICNAYLLFIMGKRCPDFVTTFGTVETRLGLWLKDHPQMRPCIVHGETLGWKALQTDQWYPDINRTDSYQPFYSLMAIQLSAGVYEDRPDLAVNPVEPNDLVTLTASFPSLPSPFVLVVAPHRADEVSRYYPVRERHDIRDAIGRHLCTALWIGHSR